MPLEATRPETKVEQLVRTFPCLTKAAGGEPWNANLFDEWAATFPISHGERCSAQFILAVWNPDHGWRCGTFNLMEALAVWDQQHHQAFLDWVVEPWWA